MLHNLGVEGSWENSRQSFWRASKGCRALKGCRPCCVVYSVRKPVQELLRNRLSVEPTLAIDILNASLGYPLQEAPNFMTVSLSILSREARASLCKQLVSTRRKLPNSAELGETTQT